MKIILIILEIIASICGGIFAYFFITAKGMQKNLMMKVEGNRFLNQTIKKRMFSTMRADFYKLNMPFSPIIFLYISAVGIGIMIVFYNIFLHIFQIKLVSLILAIPAIGIIFIIIRILANRKQERLEAVVIDFFIQLKNALKINPDITEAFRQIQNSCIEPFREYIRQMLKEINAGVIPDEALLKFSKKVDIKRFSFYINNLAYANTYGGDVEALTIGTQNIVSEVLKEKKNRIKEAKSINAVLYSLIIIDLFVYFNFIMRNPDYMMYMKTTYVGQMILGINFISIWFIVWLSYRVRRLNF